MDGLSGPRLHDRGGRDGTRPAAIHGPHHRQRHRARRLAMYLDNQSHHARHDRCRHDRRRRLHDFLQHGRAVFRYGFAGGLVQKGSWTVFRGDGPLLHGVHDHTPHTGRAAGPADDRHGSPNACTPTVYANRRHFHGNAHTSEARPYPPGSHSASHHPGGHHLQIQSPHVHGHPDEDGCLERRPSGKSHGRARREGLRP